MLLSCYSTLSEPMERKPVGSDDGYSSAGCIHVFHFKSSFWVTFLQGPSRKIVMDFYDQIDNLCKILKYVVLPSTCIL